MIIDISRLDREPLPFDVSITEAELEPDFGVRYPGGAHVIGSIARSAAEIKVLGEIEAATEIDCTRCLEPVTRDLRFAFDVRYVRPEDFSSDRETELKGEDLKLDTLEGNAVDLSVIAREQLLLELPEQVICSEECKGLCERCGTNLNFANCTCGDDEIDPRWAALEALK